MSRFWPYFFLVSILEGLVALVALFAIPAEGFSPARLALAGISILFLAGLGWLLYRARDLGWRTRWLDWTARPQFFRALAILASLLLLVSSLILFLLRYLNPEATAAYFIRARPALIWFILLGAQTILWLSVLRNGINFGPLRARRGVFLVASFGFAFFIIIWLLIVFTGLGVTRDPSYWGEPGVPILGWQLLLALLLGFCFLFFVLRRDLSPRADGFISLSIWLLAIGLWMSVPLTSLRNSFYAPIQPPYNQPFPNSDAALYDVNAQNLLLGNGFLTKIPPRPLYILFLAGLHALFGQEYARLVFGQTFIFALLPVALYFLGKKLHGRAAGLAVALLAIFRELTSLWVASDARVSNSKMLLSEFLTTLILVAYLLLVLRWFHHKRGESLLAFTCGGVLGLQILLRSQSMFIAPGILLLALFVFWPDWKKWFVQSVVFALGLILAVSPWLVRNYAHTGQVSLDDPAQILAVASMYSGGTPTSNNPLFEGQTPAQIGRFVVNTILQRPGYVSEFVANQFLANAVDTLIVLPIFARYDGLTAPIYLYWYEWDGHLSAANVSLLVVYLAVIAFGLAAAWKRLRWAGLLPLVFFLSYIFSTSLARFSGWRYVFPADWVGYFYFALGALELFTSFIVLLGAELGRAFPDAEMGLPAHPVSAWRYTALAALILLIGSMPWIVETAIPRSEPLCADSVVPCLSEQGVDDVQVRAFLDQPGALSLTGRVLYPRYFSRDLGLASTNPNPAYAPRDFPRMGFYFLTPFGVEQVILPLKGVRPFPHAVDAILLACPRERYLEVRIIVFPETGGIFTSGSLADPCPTP